MIMEGFAKTNERERERQINIFLFFVKTFSAMRSVAAPPCVLVRPSDHTHSTRTDGRTDGRTDCPETCAVNHVMCVCTYVDICFCLCTSSILALPLINFNLCQCCCSFFLERGLVLSLLAEPQLKEVCKRAAASTRLRSTHKFCL